jgi:hypothetical protein
VPSCRICRLLDSTARVACAFEVRLAEGVAVMYANSSICERR